MSTPIALKVGASIGAYKIQKVLAHTQFGVLYRASAPESKRSVNIQEFLPREFATRTRSNAKVRGRKGKENVFEDALTLFLQEARILAQIHDPYIARVHEYTEANGTAYLVMEHNKGRDLASYLSKHPEPIEETELRNILVPVLKGLRAVHNAKLLHRDITPLAIYLRHEGPPLLTWFGACHRDPKLDCSLNHRVSPGYSPIEFYHENTHQEPASDLYSLGAVMYHCIAGSAPVDPTQRLTALAQDQEDPLVPAMEIGSGNYSSVFLGIIDWMLQPMLQDRPDSAGAVLGPLSQPSKTAASNKPATAKQPQAISKPPLNQTIVEKRASMPVRKRPSRGWVWTFSVVVPLVALWLAWPIVKPLLVDAPTNESDDGTAQAIAPPEITEPSDKPAVVLQAEETQTPSDTNTSDGATPIAMDDPALEDPPPKVPDTVKFARSGDDQRAQLYRQIERVENEQESLLKSAHIYSKQGDQSRALESLRKVLLLDPNNADAKEAIAQISDKLLSEAKLAFNEKNLPRVETILTQVREITPDHFALEQLERQVADYRLEQKQLEEEKKRAEVEQQNKIKDLLKKANAAVANGHYIEPPGNNALGYYRTIQSIEPQHPAATQGIEKVALTFLDRANRALAVDDFERATKHLVTATAIQPDNPAIGLLQEQLRVRSEAARAQAVRPAQPARAPVPAPTTAVKQISSAEQKAKEADQNLRRGIEAYYAGSYDKARRLLSGLAEQNHARAQFRLGMMYYLGRGVVKNQLVAENWLRKALPEVRRLAQQGVAWAQADLGSLYEDGLVVELDTASAVRWYKRAAEQGYAGAQTNLGVMYARGIGVEPNTVEAIRWLERAAAQGDRVARENLLTLRNSLQ